MPIRIKCDKVEVSKTHHTDAMRRDAHTDEEARVRPRATRKWFRQLLSISSAKNNEKSPENRAVSECEIINERANQNCYYSFIYLFIFFLLRCELSLFGIWAHIKDVHIVATGDWLHDAWMILVFIYVHHGLNEKQSNQVNWLSHVLNGVQTPHIRWYSYTYVMDIWLTVDVRDECDVAHADCWLESLRLHTARASSAPVCCDAAIGYF